MKATMKILFATTALCVLSLSAAAQLINIPGIDPGVRTTGPISMGGPLPGLSTDELNFAAAAATEFGNPWSVSGTIVGEPIPGLGPRYDANACGACHTYPAPGGSGGPFNNEVPMATLDGAKNIVPSFVTVNGPTRIPYQVSTGALLKLYTVQGRTDAPGCVLAQPDFATLLANHDLSYHIPIPLYGVGLVEATPSSNFIADQDKPLMASLGITSGRFNRSASGISHIGWKGAASSIRAFADLAGAVELDATGEIFPRKTDETPGCMFTGLPEDLPRLTRRIPNTASVGADYASVFSLAAAFARTRAAPVPVASYASTNPKVGNVTAASIANGEAKFVSAGCAACHVKSHTTGKSSMTGQSNKTYNSWSDYALHDMGVTLRDGLTQGSAGPQDYKTTALWGLGQRLFLLHDGRTTDLNQSIQQHYSAPTSGISGGSEANQTVLNFNALSTLDQQDILNFLRSL